MVYDHYENSCKERTYQNNLIGKKSCKEIDLLTNFYCENCGKQNKYFHGYCFNCGTNLREAKEKFKKNSFA